ncbi:MULTISPECIES: tRNA (adenosine(37)-N6)-threonylcarbamoyltransferase complex dimerization subunit type 1 TsaB [unclassified Sphingomonas]|uniref:tRNA (adenosine(37)-N6)-threonylcarbamoyltransferase complex dimerization subunit type 1 TsaB n=1 Tax=unclassified Sphingomonas TaxID=196159 RepID=UPI0006F8F0E3|nr:MULTISPECIES: tRNA (adenosine(37)-N6)-threonylcarbamoyltransferase complex dimerization subunit type 1 TsaB [unclassified Sphingomonas]KQX20823.1 tRNA threonylcarbamoyladenosine biosynthesis protein TsaB [Sphingomonas sp. Root1294]KQY68669.1 tRNA threonylcarbamoyladenosine biosynthesis protein TsaB [Sphingomonas sp. Root50]KRB88074.1 tRNA threonylcarbamoyladenosine biosynthesis protein TsaB [Sphingomonas sp. Root720]
MPRALVIDTATAACSVALVEDGAVVAEAHDVVGRGHAERLMPMIAALPGGGRADSILVDCGPGSFTGVRVGLAAARALALGWGVPVHGYSSMAAIAAAAGDRGATVGIALIGGHGELFVQRYATAPLAPLSELASLSPADAAAAIPDAHVFGSGAEQLVAARGSGMAHDRLPRAAEAIALPAALARLAPSPIYGRGADAKPAP